MDPIQLLMLALLGAVLVLSTLLWRATRRAGVASRARNTHAQAGEALAEDLLADAGWTVTDRQVPFSGQMWIDDEPTAIHVRVDLLVERDGERAIAEVKTGARAPDPTFPATRRQLREYSWLLPDHRILLVDADAGTVREVAFE